MDSVILYVRACVCERVHYLGLQGHCRQQGESNFYCELRVRHILLFFCIFSCVVIFEGQARVFHSIKQSKMKLLK